MRDAWEQVYGLLVEDGQIAIGTLAAFVAAAAVAALGSELQNDMLRNSAGLLLFVLLMALLLVNLYSAGRKAYPPTTPATPSAAGSSVPKK
ncbi:MAG: hypothetical protein JO352_34960 [Chloroflexi bacterium]|nr:hypothetical protein [Chloroflexota bacterium]MBV9596807.1 hypothetical protein [Chloroflexota bacterium]